MLRSFFWSREILFLTSTLYSLQERSKSIYKTSKENFFKKCWSWFDFKEDFQHSSEKMLKIKVNT